MATQIAKEAGATVFSVCGGATKVAYARRFGADHVIDHTAGDWVEAVRGLTGGRGVDLIIDGVAGPQAPRNFEALATLGQVIYLGAIGGYAPPVDISRQLYGKSIGVRAFLLYPIMALTGGRELPAIHEALRSGRWKLPIERVWELEECAELHRRFEQRTLLGKQLVRAGGEL
jgi:NADPH2:quinone reductase